MPSFDDAYGDGGGDHNDARRARVVTAALRQRKAEMARIERVRARAGAEAFESALREAREEFMAQLRVRYDARRAMAARDASHAHHARVGVGSGDDEATTSAASRGAAKVGSDAAFALGSVLDDVRRRQSPEMMTSPSSTPSHARRVSPLPRSKTSSMPKTPKTLTPARSTESELYSRSVDRAYVDRAAYVSAHHHHDHHTSTGVSDVSPSPTHRRSPRGRADAGAFRARAQSQAEADERDLLASVADMVRRAESLRAQLSPSRFN
jgi:hypothetical protein